jgi:hypothetical protein
VETIIRVQKNRQNPYVMIRNSVFEDPLISWKAKGLMGYFLSRPDHWTILLADLVKRSPDGRDKVYSGLAELKQHGYVEHVFDRDQGKIVRGRYIVYEEPQAPHPENPETVGTDEPYPDFPDTAQPDGENPPLVIKDQELITDQQPRTEKDLRPIPETDPSTPPESPDLTALPCNAAPEPTELSAWSEAPAIQKSTETLLAVDEPCRDETRAEKDDQTMEPSTPEPSNSSTARTVSPEAKRLADGLKQRLKDRGVTVFPRDWHLKAQASAKRLLATLSTDEAEALMDWALAHPFWGTKISDLYRIVTLAPEWQQERQRSLTVRSEAVAPTPSRTETVPDRNMALLRRLYATATPSKEARPDGSA